jgi:hypothetical protein
LLVFPSGFLLAQVYTEGLSIRLTFSARAFLLLSMVMVWLSNTAWQEGWKSPILHGLAALWPALSYGVWSLTPLAHETQLVEDRFFGHGRLAVGPSITAWRQTFQSFYRGSPQPNSVMAWVPQPSRR